MACSCRTRLGDLPGKDIEAAQAYGVRVHLWGIEPPYGTNQAERLVWESDTVDVLDGGFLRPYFTKNPAAEAPRPDIQAKARAAVTAATAAAEGLER